jgi:hypothetical protein
MKPPVMKRKVSIRHRLGTTFNIYLQELKKMRGIRLPGF